MTDSRSCKYSSDAVAMFVFKLFLCNFFVVTVLSVKLIMKYLCNCSCCIFVRAYFFSDESTWQNLTRYDLIGSLLREHQSNLSVGFYICWLFRKEKNLSYTQVVFILFYFKVSSYLRNRTE